MIYYRMLKRLLLPLIIFSLGILVSPRCLWAAINSQAQQQLISQTDMSRQSQETGGVQEEQKAEIHARQNKPRPVSAGPAFEVKEIVLKGNTIFTTRQLMPLVRPYENRMLHLKDLQDLANLITARYQVAGYITSSAYVPAQKIKDGRVIIRIMEVRVARIVLRGNRWFADDLYLDRIALKPGQFVNTHELAMSMQEINQLPDRSVKAYLQPGAAPGTSDIDLVAQDHNPLHFSYEYNNDGTVLTHLSRNILHFTDNNLTGRGDTLDTSLSLAAQNELVGGNVGYTLPDPLRGVVYSLNMGGAYSRLGKDLRPDKVTADSFYVTPGVTKNFIKEPLFTLDGFADFEIKNSKTLEDNNKLSYDRDRVVDLGPRASFTDGWGKTFLAGDTRAGIPDFLGGSELHDLDASRLHSGGEFIYWTGSFDRINAFPFGTTLVLHGGGQYSPMALNSLEQFYLGGMGTVRGYPESDSSGDSAVDFSAEVRIPLYFIPEGLYVGPGHERKLRDALSLVTFIDGGRVFNRYTQESSSYLDRTLLSAGIGLRYYVDPDMNFQVGMGFPFGDLPLTGDKHDQVYLEVRVGF